MSSSRTSTTTVEVNMPQMGVSVAEGTIVEWRKRVGDWVEADEAIVEISTDKVETEIPSPASGRVAEILVEPGALPDRREAHFAAPVCSATIPPANSR